MRLKLRNISHTEIFNKLTNNETNIENKNTNNYNISAITRYHANAEYLQTIIRNDWYISQDNSQLNLFEKRFNCIKKREQAIHHRLVTLIINLIRST